MTIAEFIDEGYGTSLEVYARENGVVFQMDYADVAKMSVRMDREELRGFVSYLTRWIEMKDKEDVQ